MPELRWTLLIIGVLFIAILAWWERRRPHQASRQSPHIGGEPRTVVNNDPSWGSEGDSAGPRSTPHALREPTLTLPEIRTEVRTRDSVASRELPIVEMPAQRAVGEELLSEEMDEISQEMSHEVRKEPNFDESEINELGDELDAEEFGEEETGARGKDAGAPNVMSAAPRQARPAQAVPASTVAGPSASTPAHWASTPAHLASAPVHAASAPTHAAGAAGVPSTAALTPASAEVSARAAPGAPLASRAALAGNASPAAGSTPASSTPARAALTPTGSSAAGSAAASSTMARAALAANASLAAGSAPAASTLAPAALTPTGSSAAGSAPAASAPAPAALTPTASSVMGSRAASVPAALTPAASSAPGSRAASAPAALTPAASSAAGSPAASASPAPAPGSPAAAALTPAPSGATASAQDAQRPPDLSPTPAPGTGPAKPIVDWPPEDQRKLISIRLVARPPDRFRGTLVRQALYAEGFVLGDLDIFHKPDSQNRAVLSAASLTKPGTFDLGTMDTQRYGGLNLFAVLPGPKTPRKAFEDLLTTARMLNERLEGALQDERGGPLTPMRIQALRDALETEAKP